MKVTEEWEEELAKLEHELQQATTTVNTILVQLVAQVDHLVYATMPNRGFLTCIVSFV